MKYFFNLSGSAGESRKRWHGLGASSRTPSATSLSVPSPHQYGQRSIVVPKRVTPTGSDWRYVGSLVSSRESLTPASPASLSPRECAAAAFQYGLNASLSRWSSSRWGHPSSLSTAIFQYGGYSYIFTLPRSRPPSSNMAVIHIYFTLPRSRPPSSIWRVSHIYFTLPRSRPPSSNMAGEA